MDRSGRSARAPAEVSHVYCGLRCVGDRSRYLGIDRIVAADGDRNPVRGVAVVPCGETRAPLLYAEIRNERDGAVKAGEDHRKGWTI